MRGRIEMYRVGKTRPQMKVGEGPDPRGLGVPHQQVPPLQDITKGCFDRTVSGMGLHLRAITLAVQMYQQQNDPLVFSCLPDQHRYEDN